MPEIHVYALKGPSLDQKRTLVREATSAMEEHFKVTKDWVQISFFEVDGETRASHGLMYVDGPPMERDITEVQIFALEGRTIDQRRALSKALNRIFEDHYDAKHVVISFIEITPGYKANHGQLYIDGNYIPQT